MKIKDIEIKKGDLILLDYDSLFRQKKGLAIGWFDEPNFFQKIFRWDFILVSNSNLKADYIGFKINKVKKIKIIPLFEEND